LTKIHKAGFSQFLGLLVTPARQGEISQVLFCSWGSLKDVKRSQFTDLRLPGLNPTLTKLITPILTRTKQRYEEWEL
jgi:hypothetical protein